MSASLRLTQASFSYAADRVLLDGVDLHLTPGWTGLVGPNGAGKSTLLRILSGELSASGVHREPGDLSVVRVQQRIDHPSERVEAFSLAWDSEAVRLQSRLKLGLDDLERWSSLSPGERRRWQIGAALWKRPGALLLDEPDNHLDIEARSLLVDTLASYGGIGVLISHDRALLDQLTTRTVRLRGGQLDTVDAPWSQAQEVWEAREQALLDELDASKQRVQRQVRQARQAQAERASATRGRSLRHVDPRDHDARSVARKYRAAKAESAHAQKAARLSAQAERVTQAHAALDRPQDLGRDVFVDHEPARRSTLLTLQADAVRPAPDAPAVLHHVDVTLRRGAHVWLAGPNGAGKSTLVRALLSQASLPDQALFVLPQELSEDQAAGLLERLHQAPSDRRGRVLQLVAALGVDPAHLLSTQRPSPGEARKLALALGLHGPTWALVLDEPTHHLDLPARQRLERALAAFPGAVLLITHDVALGRATCTERWRLAEQRVHVETVPHGADGHAGGASGRRRLPAHPTP